MLGFLLFFYAYNSLNSNIFNASTFLKNQIVLFTVGPIKLWNCNAFEKSYKHQASSFAVLTVPFLHCKFFIRLIYINLLNSVDTQNLKSKRNCQLKNFSFIIWKLKIRKKLVNNLYINLACLSVCLFVCLFVSNKRQNG